MVLTGSVDPARRFHSMRFLHLIDVLQTQVEIVNRVYRKVDGSNWKATMRTYSIQLLRISICSCSRFHIQGE